VAWCVGWGLMLVYSLIFKVTWDRLAIRSRTKISCCLVIGQRFNGNVPSSVPPPRRLHRTGLFNYHHVLLIQPPQFIISVFIPSL
jgi:hypothetical protein